MDHRGLLGSLSDHVDKVNYFFLKSLEFWIITVHSAFLTFLFALFWEGRVQTTRTTVTMLLLLNNTIFWVLKIHHLEIKLSLSVDKMHTYLLSYFVTESSNYGG